MTQRFEKNIFSERCREIVRDKFFPTPVNWISPRCKVLYTKFINDDDDDVWGELGELYEKHNHSVQNAKRKINWIENLL